MAKIEQLSVATFTATLVQVTLFFLLWFTGEIVREWVLLAFSVVLAVVSILGLLSNTTVAIATRRLLPAARALVCVVAVGAYAWWFSTAGWGEL